MKDIEKPSHEEDEYFKRQNLELLKQQRERLDLERAKAARSVHFMKCPKCGGDLQEREHHHVKIDVCPDCRGVWLDAGELEQLERAQGGSGNFLGNLLGWSR